MSKRIISLVLVVCMLMAAFVGCTKKQEPTAPVTTPDESTTDAVTPTDPAPTDGVMKLQWTQRIGIDALFENPWVDQQSLYPYLVFDALVSQNADGSYVGSLATEWTISDDGLQYVFTLREDALWHDGQPFTGKDAAFSLAAAIGDPNSSYLTQLASIDGYGAVKAGEATTLSGVSVDGNTLTVKLSKPNRNFLYGLALCYILPSHILGDVAPVDIDAFEAYWSKPVGTGMYKIDQVAFPDYFTCVANESYWGNQPTIKNVQFTSYQTGGNDAVVASLIAGELDFAYGNAVNDIEVAGNVSAQNTDVVAQMSTSYYTRYFVFNLAGRADGADKKTLQDASVRQALNLLIDKEAVASFYDGQAVALTTFVNPASTQYNSDIPVFKRDVDTAVKMLTSAGFDFTKPLDIAYYYDDQTTADIMAMLVQNFAEAGIKINTTLLSGDLATLLYKTRNFDFVYSGYSGASDPIQLYGDLLSAGPKNEMIGHLEARTEIFDPLMNDYLASMDGEAAKDVGDELQATAMEHCYTAPVYSLNAISMINSGRLSIPEDIFGFDNALTRNWRFDEWTLLK